MKKYKEFIKEQVNEFDPYNEEQWEEESLFEDDEIKLLHDNGYEIGKIDPNAGKILWKDIIGMAHKIGEFQNKKFYIDIIKDNWLNMNNITFKIFTDEDKKERIFIGNCARPNVIDALKISINTINKFLNEYEIIKENDHFDIDPYDEENWDDENCFNKKEKSILTNYGIEFTFEHYWVDDGNVFIKAYNDSYYYFARKCFAELTKIIFKNQNMTYFLDLYTDNSKMNKIISFDDDNLEKLFNQLSVHYDNTVNKIRNGEENIEL